MVIVDDILSTGGTMSAIANALRENGISISDILVVLCKDSDRKELNRHLGIDFKRMLDISIENGTVTVTDPSDLL